MPLVPLNWSETVRTLPCRIDLNLEMIAVVDVDEGNVGWIETDSA